MKANTILHLKRAKAGPKIPFLLFSLFLASFFVIISPAQRGMAQLIGTFMEHEHIISRDEEGERFLMPSFVFVEPVKNEIYIIDGKTRIMIYSEDFFPMHILEKKDGIEAPQGLTVDKEGNLYIAQTATNENPRHRISVFNPCLKWERDIYLTGFEGSEDFIPHRLALDSTGNIYVAAAHFPLVLVIDSEGNLLDIMSYETDIGKKVALTDVTIDKDGRIYLLSDEMGQVYVYDKKRQFLMQFGEKGGSSGKLSTPKGLAIDNRNGRIYVVDYMRHTVAAYDREGNFVFEFGGRGWSNGWFQFPNDLSVDNNGKVWVADFFNNRVQIFSPLLLTKQIPTMNIVRISEQDFIGKSYRSDTLLGYSLQQRLKFEQVGYSIQQPLSVELHSQGIPDSSP